MRYTLSVVVLCMFTGSLYTQEVSQAQLLAHWSNDELPSSNAHDNTYNEIWGLSINDKEFAVIGSTMGTHIIDVTDTDNIQETFFIEGAHTGPAIIHRDYHDHDGFLYAVADEGNSSLQIIDIRNLPDSYEVVYDSNDLLSRSHNIFIDEENDRLYSCSHRSEAVPFSALRVFDISDPTNPIDLGGYNTFQSYQVGHVHDAYVKNHIAYLNCGPNGFLIADMEDLASIKLLSLLESDDYPDSGYNHSGWLAEEGDVYYMADENHGLALKAINVADFNDLETKSLFDVGEDQSDAIAHNLIVDGNLLFVSYYYNGLQVYDISSREEPRRVLQYPTSQLENDLAYRGAWGVYPFLPSGNVLVSDMQEGLFVVDRSYAVSSNEETIDASFVLFPNPSVDELHVSFTSSETKSYRITDFSGRILQDGKINQKVESLDTSALGSGSYIIEIYNEQESQAQMFSIIK